MEQTQDSNIQMRPEANLFATVRRSLTLFRGDISVTCELRNAVELINFHQFQ